MSMAKHTCVQSVRNAVHDLNVSLHWYLSPSLRVTTSPRWVQTLTLTQRPWSGEPTASRQFIWTIPGSERMCVEPSPHLQSRLCFMHPEILSLGRSFFTTMAQNTGVEGRLKSWIEALKPREKTPWLLGISFEIFLSSGQFIKEASTLITRIKNILLHGLLSSNCIGWHRLNLDVSAMKLDVSARCKSYM